MTEQMHGVTFFFALIHSAILMAGGGLVYGLLRLKINRYGRSLPRGIARVLLLLWCVTCLMPVVTHTMAWRGAAGGEGYSDFTMQLMMSLASPQSEALVAVVLIALGALMASVGLRRRPSGDRP